LKSDETNHTMPRLQTIDERPRPYSTMQSVSPTGKLILPTLTTNINVRFASVSAPLRISLKRADQGVQGKASTSATVQTNTEQDKRKGEHQSNQNEK
jgi:hypothetical protein